MKKKTRRIFFYFLILIFAVSAPIIIGYSLGYTFNLTKRSVETTGGIFVKLETASASVFLDNVFIKETSLLSNGALLTDVKPGIHILRIEKTGHTPWSKTVTVEPTLVTELRNILLVKTPLLSSPAGREELAAVQAVQTSSPKNIRFVTASSIPFSIDPKGNLISRRNASTTVWATHVNSMAKSAEDRILWIDTNGFLAELDPQTKTVTTVGRPGFFISPAPARFFTSPAGDTLIIDASGGLFMLSRDRVLRAIEPGVKNVRFDEEGTKALIIKDKEIKILWLQENQHQPFEKNGTLETILSLQSPIQDGAWLFETNAHIVLQTGEGIFMTEIDGRGGRNTTELFTGSAGAIATNTSYPDTLFFKQGKTWKKIEIR